MNCEYNALYTHTYQGYPLIFAETRLPTGSTEKTKSKPCFLSEETGGRGCWRTVQQLYAGSGFMLQNQACSVLSLTPPLFTFMGLNGNRADETGGA